ncbi:hypothetical protein [Spirochaeta dissipatitropha]
MLLTHQLPESFHKGQQEKGVIKGLVIKKCVAKATVFAVAATPLAGTGAAIDSQIAKRVIGGR